MGEGERCPKTVRDGKERVVYLGGGAPQQWDPQGGRRLMAKKRDF